MNVTKIELIDKAITELINWPSSEPEETHLYQFDSGRFVAGISGGSTPAPFCTRAEFLARKAERQNKPDWSEHNYRFICQGKNGLWYGSQKENPPPLPFYLTGDDWHFIPSASGGNGEVFGCYHDTLEQRPAATEPEWPDEERIDIIGTNGNDGLSYATKAPEFKHGAGVFNLVGDDLHARGELPPVGTKCLCWFDDGRECWHECIVIGSIDSEIKNGYLAVSLIGKHERKLVWANEFRPLRTEREKFIEAAMSAAGDYHKLEDILADLFDAGFRAPGQK